MRRKKGKAKRPTKQPLKKVKKLSRKTVSKRAIYSAGAYHKRGTARKSITFPPGKKSIEKVVKTLENYDWRKFDYLRRRNKPDGHNYKPPQGITVVIEITKRNQQWVHINLSPIEFVVKGPTVKAFAIKTYTDMVDEWIYKKDAIESGEIDTALEGSSDPENLDPRYITALAVNFMYGK